MKSDQGGHPARPGGLVTDGTYVLQPIGWVDSPLVGKNAAPKQGSRGITRRPARLRRIDGRLRDLEVGSEILVLTWLDRARRDVLVVHPRDDLTNPQRGVFSTRSADRPNPIGLHRVTISAITGSAVEVQDLEALDGTPVVDIKPVLHPLDR
ncbi:tRNA (N6-threonylcarbamoyladenosine(37)-N6)-methyltransferase TrmO [Pseudonocardia sp.]|uniref:tRNA (N6-threonylcarbamoyladenosine(37)-N6)-methyltransferase TrmO n=1 Tax=Pseudonocardia sp. TaxID=60912 RepID=UPI0031FDE120